MHTHVFLPVRQVRAKFSLSSETDEAVLQRTELRALHWVEPRHLEGRVAPYVARHLASIGSGEAAGLVLEDGIPTQE